MSIASMPRIAGDLPLGATIDDNGVTWTKVDEYPGWRDSRGNEMNNRAVDRKLSLGATIVIDVIDLETELIKAYEVEQGDYVVLTQGFYEAGGDHQRFLLEEYRSQQLWRVAGWTWHGEKNSTVMLDAPEDLLRDTSRQMHGEDGGDMDPVQLYVDPEDVMHLVVPGQTHETWQWDWSYEYDGFVDPRGDER
jgi:hypothetical protein